MQGVSHNYHTITKSHSASRIKKAESFGFATCLFGQKYTDKLICILKTRFYSISVQRAGRKHDLFLLLYEAASLVHLILKHA